MSKVKAVVFDWAGTMVDFGSFAPMGVFVETFKQFGIEVSVEEARGPMGMPKRDHIAAMIRSDRIADAWTKAYDGPPSEADIDKVYDVFVPMNEKVAADYAGLVLAHLKRSIS